MTVANPGRRRPGKMSAMPQSSAAGDPNRVLERFLVGDSTKLPPARLLQESGLAGYASSRPAAGAQRDDLRSTHLATTALHLATRAKLRPLLGAWAAAGIEAMLFKGFHLAEFVYPLPGMRRYSDVDLLIREQDALRAAEVAQALGWKELWHAAKPATAHTLRGPRYQGHEVVQLLHPQLGVQVDVHRRLVHNNHNRIGRNSLQLRITRLARKSSQAVDWEGVPVLLPHPLDAVLIGLVLNRCWSPEDWTLRPHDYLDFRYLIERYSLELPQLRDRARELGCSTTFELFLERCDPFERRCTMSAPSKIELQRWNLLVASERGNRYLQRSRVEIVDWVRGLAGMIAELPGVALTLFEVRRFQDLRQAAESYESRRSMRSELDPEFWQRLRRAVHRGIRLLVRRNRFRRDLEAVALLAALRRRSFGARLRWVADDSGEERPLLELAGRPLNRSGTLLLERR